MGPILVTVDSWISVIFVGAMMIAAWAIGSWHGKRLSAADRANIDA